MTQPRKKLIEVALPLEAINAASAHEKMPGIGPHPRGIHLWWARRPLATCRAVLFAQLVDDPSALPDEFPTPEAQDAERKRLWEIIERLVPWENVNNETVLDQARREIARSVARAHGVRLPADADHAQVQAALRVYAPPVLDPFAGGGSIPLEAQRLGLAAHASDLNPVAVLINKALIEIPPCFAGRPPVNPQARRGTGQGGTWKGASGLAEDVRYYGAWMHSEAKQRIGHLYPKVALPKEYGGGEATVIAWLWARTVTCPNPACGARMPLISSFQLSNKAGKAAWVEPQVDRSATPPAIRFTVRTGIGTAPDPPKLGRGANFKCLACGVLAEDRQIKAEGMAGRMGAQLMAVVAEGQRGRIYLPPTHDQEATAAQARPEWKSEALMPENPRWFSPPAFGMRTFGDLFTLRQLVALTTFSDLVGTVRTEAGRAAVAAGLLDDGVPLAASGTGAQAYGDAVATYLAFAVDRCADFNAALARWVPGNEKVMNVYARQAIPMVWDYAEVNVLAKVVGGFEPSKDYIADCMSTLPGTSRTGEAMQLDATVSSRPAGSFLVSTDPPYYDNIGYADLSDFFYVWLRRSLSKVYPSLFSTLLVPKKQELIATPYRFGGSREEAQAFFETGLGQTFELMRSIACPDYPLTIYYAYKQSESEYGEADHHDHRDATVGSTGWETMLTGLLQAGFQITGTWPVRSEQSSRIIAAGTNALASSIVLVCRPHPAEAALATRRDFLRALKSGLPAALQVLTSGRVAPVDLAQAAIGPGMAIFSNYAKVLEPDGRPMSVHAALGAINEVIQIYFAEQEGDLDPATQFCLTWYKQYGTVAGPHGQADILSKAKDVTIGRLVQDSLLKHGGGWMQLYPASADVYQDSWDPRNERSFTIWSATQHLVAAHRRGGNAAAAEIAAALGGYAEQARTLAYALYQIASAPGHGWTEEALGYNNLVADWPEIQRQAAAAGTRPAQLGLGM